ncbi:hypothetical protein [Acinetobacter radioresistens]|uniref:hypothetical protein n=1 Tax=Acinetobacter radioresistens TaxID=40216 RepID=UPI001D18CDDD|nr:hypothetical protein [Acinetobacter radioresistens]
MNIKEKQASWAVERPLFEAEFIHSHLLPFFNFNENTGDYEIKSECVSNTDDEDRKVAYEALNTGWAMWLRAKRNVKAQAVPEGNALLSATLDAIQKLGSGDFVLVSKELNVKEARKHAEVMFSKVENMVRYEQRGLSESEFESFKNRWLDARTLTIQFDWKAMVQAQEQAND